MNEKSIALNDLKNRLFERQIRSSIVEFGDFTYGHPLILQWGEGSKLHVGKFCSIAEGVEIMLGGDHRNDWCSTYPFNAWLPDVYGDIKGHPYSKGDIWIGNDVWLARGCKIMSGVHIHDGVTVAANAVVTKDVAPYTVVGGVPAKVIKRRFDKKAVDHLIEMQWWDWDLDHIAEAVPLLQADNIDKLYAYYKEWHDGN